MNFLPIICGQLMIFLCCMGEAMAVQRFCREYLEISAIRSKMFIIFFLAGRMAIEAILSCYFIPFFLYSFIQNGIFAVLVLFLFQAETGKKVFILFLLILERRLLFEFFSSAFSSLLLFIQHIMGKEPVMQIWWEECILSCLVYMAGIAVIYLISGFRISYLGEFSGKRLVVLAVPFVLLIVISDMLGQAASKGILLRSGGDWGIYYDQLFSHAGICLFSLLSMLGIGVYLISFDRIFLEIREKERYSAGVAAYKAMEGQYCQMERLRHDLKNHLIGLQGLLKDREWDKMERYLHKMIQEGAVSASEAATGRRALDALLFYKRKLAEGKNIVWECDLKIPKECLIDEFDLCILFGNILDNAIEACEKLEQENIRFVHVESRMVKKCFLLEVKNGTDLQDICETGHTGKENPEGHGFGMQNIKNIVYRYNGMLNMEIQENVFVLSVLLCNLEVS